MPSKRANIGIQPVVVRGGFLDTTTGLCLTSPEALSKAAVIESAWVAKRAELLHKEAEKVARECVLYEQKKAQRLRGISAALMYRVTAYVDPNVEPRPLLLRRQIAKRRLAAKKASILRAERP